MGKYVFRLPDIGEGIAEAEIVAWHVKIGDLVEEDGRLADMMTDKATVEMESPVSGKIIQVAGEVGDIVAIGSPLVVIETEGGEVAEDAPAPEPVKAPEPVPAPAVVAKPEPEISSTPTLSQNEREIEVAPVPQGRGHGPSSKVVASPAVRARAKELGIDLGEVRAAGCDGFPPSIRALRRG